MLGYVTVGARDLDRMTAFYDALFAPLGGRRIHAFDRGVFYGEKGMEFGVVRPFDDGDAQPGNGPMAALNAPTRAAVDEVYTLAMSMGAADEGAPGIRGSEASGFYGAYFRDPEGNKLCVFRMGPA